jgi:hypothetical protein
MDDLDDAGVFRPRVCNNAWFGHFDASTVLALLTGKVLEPDNAIAADASKNCRGKGWSIRWNQNHQSNQCGHKSSHPHRIGLRRLTTKQGQPKLPLNGFHCGRQKFSALGIPGNSLRVVQRALGI